MRATHKANAPSRSRPCPGVAWRSRALLRLQADQSRARQQAAGRSVVAVSHRCCVVCSPDGLQQPGRRRGTAGVVPWRPGRAISAPLGSGCTESCQCWLLGLRQGRRPARRASSVANGSGLGYRDSTQARRRFQAFCGAVSGATPSRTCLLRKLVGGVTGKRNFPRESNHEWLLYADRGPLHRRDWPPPWIYHCDGERPACRRLVELHGCHAGVRRQNPTAAGRPRLPPLRSAAV